jgi:hypothetical protein
MMDEAKPVNGQINLAQRIPEFVGKLFLWLVPSPQDGPGMYRYSETPRMTAQERAAIEPPQHVERPALPQQVERNSAVVLPASASSPAHARILDSIRITDAERGERGNDHERE